MDDKQQFEKMIKREFLLDPETPQAEYDKRWIILIFRNFPVADAIGMEMDITYEVMMEHVEIILQHPELFD